jgi:hypothetical protein
MKLIMDLQQRLDAIYDKARLERESAEEIAQTCIRHMGADKAKELAKLLTEKEQQQ